MAASFIALPRELLFLTRSTCVQPMSAVTKLAEVYVGCQALISDCFLWQVNIHNKKSIYAEQ